MWSIRNPTPAFGTRWRKRKLIVWGAFLLPVFLLGFGCAHLINSQRPPYEGPIIKPLCMAAGLACDTMPVIYDGIVYVTARMLDSDVKHLYAFELRSGKQLWVSNFIPADIKFYINPMLFVTDDKGTAHSLDGRTGRDILQPSPTKLVVAGTSGTTLYAVWANSTITAMDNPQHIVWTAQMPMTRFGQPLIHGGTVYVSGGVEKDSVKRDVRIHALDSKTGAERWHWSSGTEGDAFSKLTADADTIYMWFGTTTGTVVALDASTGKPRWTVKNSQYFMDGAMLGVDPAAAVIRESLQSGLHFRAVSRASGQDMWESTTNWKYKEWTADGERLYVSDRQAHAMLNEAGDTSPDSWLTMVDVRTGKEQWRSAKIELADFTDPAIADGIVVVGSFPYRFRNKNAAFVAAFSTGK